MNWESVKWSLLMLWIGGVSAAVVLWTDVPLWFVVFVLFIVTPWGRPSRGWRPGGARTFPDPTHEPPAEVTPRAFHDNAACPKCRESMRTEHSTARHQ